MCKSPQAGKGFHHHASISYVPTENKICQVQPLNSQSFHNGVHSNRFGIISPKQASTSSENTFRGSLKPKQWRTSYDTKEIQSILAPIEPTGELSIKNTTRYETHNMN